MVRALTWMASGSGSRRRMPIMGVLGLLGVGHLLGGASAAGPALGTTLVVCLLALWLMLEPGVLLREPVVRSALYGTVLYGLVMVQALVSVVPGSDVLASGIFADRVGASTLALDPAAARLELFKLGGLAAMALVGALLSASINRLRTLLVGLIAVGAAWSVWALALTAVTAAGGDVQRLSGAFVSPNVAGALIALSLILLAGQTSLAGSSRRRRSRRLSRSLSLPVAVLLVVALMLSASRASVGLGIGLAAVLYGWRWVQARALDGVSENHSRRVRWAVLGTTSLCMAGLGGRELVARFANTADDAQDRMAIADIYLQASSQAPVFGHGLGALPVLSRQLLTPENDAIFWNIRAAHNVFVQWAVETGWLGVALIASSIGLMAVKAFFALGERGRHNLAGPLAALLFVALHSLVDYTVQIYSLALTVALLLGVCLGGVGQTDTFWQKFERSGRERRHRLRV